MVLETGAVLVQLQDAWSNTDRRINLGGRNLCTVERMMTLKFLKKKFRMRCLRSLQLWSPCSTLNLNPTAPSSKQASKQAVTRRSPIMGHILLRVTCRRCLDFALKIMANITVDSAFKVSRLSHNGPESGNRDYTLHSHLIQHTYDNSILTWRLFLNRSAIG